MKNVEDIYPLSPMQQGMLFHALHDPALGLYFEQSVCTLEGELELPAFQRAWQHVLRRHTALRSAFVWQDMEAPLQIVRALVELNWTIDDWRGLPDAVQTERLEQFCQADRREGFNLGRAPLLRLALFRTAERCHTLVWSFPHLLCDGWSIMVVLGEVLHSYEAFADARTPVLASARPYRDYIAWLQRRDPIQTESFWRGQLGSFAAATPLGVDRPLRPDSGPPRSASHEHMLSVEATAVLRSFARQHRLTLNTLVQGAWALLLGRYSGIDDLVFGITVSGRPADLSGVETTVGLFINTLPLRVRLPSDLPLQVWLQDLQALQVELRQYEHSPLVDVQGWSAVPRGLPLFESLLVFENYPATQPGATGAQPPRLRLSGMVSEERTNYPLTLCVAVGDALAIKVLYDQRRFDADTVARMVGHLGMLLECMPTCADAKLDALPILTAREHQILDTWNATRTDYPRDATVHACFAAQAAQTPEAVALVCEGQILSYHTLNTRANRLALALRTQGVGHEMRVGLCLRRSTELIVAMLAILKADAAYVPLDPDYPRDRLAFMLADADVALLITDTLLRDLIQPEVPTLCLDEHVDALALLPADNPPSRADATSLAYLMYTSGSTGQPKGSSITHRSIVRLVRGTDYADFSPDQVFLQFAPVSFDAATLEIWGPLLNGGRLVIFPPHIPSLDELGQCIKTQGITTLWLTAGLFNQMVDEQLPQLAGLRQLLTGGDVVSPAHVRRALEELPGCTVINGYGPTENTTFTCCHPMRVPEQVEQPVPIGRPIANTRVYILDRRLQPVPIGVVGDLYAAADGLARDYHRRPVLTAERFIPDPFASEPGARLYRTGDQARYRADGMIEFLGRSDQQVKLHGFRIELGEIETALSQHPTVRECIVLIQELQLGQKRLTAFFVPELPEGGRIPSPREFREFLTTRLPDYMIPAMFAAVEAFPLTPNGKIDRRALLAPNRVYSDSQTEYVAPRDQIEFRLTQIWEHVLGVRPIGVRHNFFDVGGQSMLAMRLMTQIQREFGVRLPTSVLFQEPTIAELAQHLHAPATVQDWTPLVLLQDGGSEPPLFLMPPGGGSAFSYIPLVRNLRTDRRYYGLQSRGMEAGQLPFANIGEMTDCFITAIRHIQPSGPYLLAGWSAGGNFALEVAQRLRTLDQEVAFLGVMDTLLQKPENINDVLSYADQLIALVGPANLPMSIDEFHALEREEQIQIVVDLAWQIGLVSPETGRDQVLRIVDVVGANIRAAMHYEPRPYDSRLTLFKTYKDPEEAKNNKVILSHFDDLLGWGQIIAPQNLDVVVVPGDHQNMLSMPHVLTLAEQLQIRLDTAAQEQPAPTYYDTIHK